MLFKFTNAVSAEMKNLSLCKENAENRFCEWICDFITLGNKKYYFVANAYSMVSVLFEAEKINTLEEFGKKCSDEIKKLCIEKGWASLYEEFIQPFSQNFLAAKNDNRSIAAKMTHERSHIDFFYKFTGGKLLEVEKRICKEHMTNLGGSGEEKTEPEKVFVSDFMKKSSETDKKREKTYFEFYAELEDFDGKVWRRFVTDSSSKMSDLASTLIALFEGQGEHLYRFDFKKSDETRKIYEEMFSANGVDKLSKKQEILIENLSDSPDFTVTLPDPDDIFSNANFSDMEKDGIYFPPLPPEKDAYKTKICDCFKKDGEKCTFVYDFGDNWTFLLRLEKVIQNEEMEVPFATDGKGYGIFENIGGSQMLEEAYSQFEKKEGDLYDYFSSFLENPDSKLEEFDVKKMNKSLKKKVRRFNSSYKEF